MKTVIRTMVVATACVTAITATTAQAADKGDSTVRNLERERAAMIDILLDPNLDSAKRQQQISANQRRLIDLERMVLRDDKLKGVSTLVVKKAFDNYDLTFLAHAALEDGQAVGDHWLEHMGLDTGSLKATSMGRRQF